VIELDKQQKNEKRMFCIDLLKKGISHRDINMFSMQKYGEGVSHTLLSKWDNQLRSGIDPSLEDQGSCIIDPNLISKMRELIELLKAKNNEHKIAIKQLLMLFVSISNILTDNKLDQDSFEELVKQYLDLELIDKYQSMIGGD